MTTPKSIQQLRGNFIEKFRAMKTINLEAMWIRANTDWLGHRYLFADQVVVLSEMQKQILKDEILYRQREPFLITELPDDLQVAVDIALETIGQQDREVFEHYRPAQNDPRIRSGHIEVIAFLAWKGIYQGASQGHRLEGSKMRLLLKLALFLSPYMSPWEVCSIDQSGGIQVNNLDVWSGKAPYSDEYIPSVSLVQEFAQGLITEDTFRFRSNHADSAWRKAKPMVSYRSSEAPFFL